MISHPMGKSWHEELKAEDHQMVPHSLPDEATLIQLARDLPLQIQSFVDDRDLYMALLQAISSSYAHMLDLLIPLLFSLLHIICPCKLRDIGMQSQVSSSRPESDVALFCNLRHIMRGAEAPSMCLQVPPAYLLSAPITLEGRVVEGFGRGSAQMGVPTANIEPGPLKDRLEGLPLGVYFGCVHCHS